MTKPDPNPIETADANIRKRQARAALDRLTGPERVDVLRHYGGSAKKAIAANTPPEPWCEECQDVGSWACSEHAS